MRNLALCVLISFTVSCGFTSSRYGQGGMPDYTPTEGPQLTANFEDRIQVSVRPLRFTADPLALGLGQTSTILIDNLLQVEVLSRVVDDYDIFVTCAGTTKEQYPTTWLPFHSQPEPGLSSYISFLARKANNDSLVVTIVSKQDTLCCLFTGFSHSSPEGGEP